MKNQRGITLSALMIYVVITIIVTATLSAIIIYFTKNVAEMNKNNMEIAELDKFNTYFLQEVKRTNNDISLVSNDKTRIEFTSGNTYCFNENAIYLNDDIIIAENIEACEFSQDIKDGKKVAVAKITIDEKAYTYEYVLSNKTAQNTINESDYISSSWIDNGNDTFTNIKIGLTVKVGDFVNYDSPTDYETPDANGKKKGWRILGVENGNLLIMADSSVGNKRLEGSDGYFNAQKELDEMCQAYKDNNYAISARSIRVEDINKITGYNPLCEGVKNPTQEQISKGDKIYNKGQPNEYGNKIKYTLKDGNVWYQHGNEEPIKSSYHEFTHIDGTKLVSAEEYDLAEDKTGIAKEIEIESNYYEYHPNSLGESGTISESNPGISGTSAAYDMIFNKYDGKKDQYWLASPCVCTSWDRCPMANAHRARLWRRDDAQFLVFLWWLVRWLGRR